MLEEYNYNEQESGRTETLVGTIEELKKVKKQLEIAEEVITWVKEFTDMPRYIVEFEPINERCEKALKRIKEVK